MLLVVLVARAPHASRDDVPRAHGAGDGGGVARADAGAARALGGAVRQDDARAPRPRRAR